MRFERNQYIGKNWTDLTKSITITYKEADENTLMAIFNKFKVKIMPTAQQHEADADYDDDDDEEGVPLSVALDMVESLKWIKQVERGEVEPITWEQMMAELEAENVQEVAIAAWKQSQRLCFWRQLKPYRKNTRQLWLI